jgi:hypothetical protein
MRGGPFHSMLMTKSAAEGFFDLCQMMPAVANRVVFNHELSRYRRVVAETERCGGVELLVGEGMDYSRRFATVLPQQFDCFGLGNDTGFTARP